jgi:hypothetical protein
MKLKPDEFWRLTCAEFVEMYDGYVRRQKNRINELIYLAWHVEAFHRQPKALPDLQSLMLDVDESRRVTPKRMTDEQMMAMAKVLNAAFGGEFVE